MTKDSLRKIILNSLLPNLEGIYDKLVLSPVPAGGNFTIGTFLTTRSAVKMLGIRYFFIDNDIIEEIFSLLSPNNGSALTKRSKRTDKYRLYPVKFNGDVICENLFCKKVSFPILPGESRVSWIPRPGRYPKKIITKVNDLLAKCKPICIIHRYKYSLFSSCAYRWGVPGAPIYEFDQGNFHYQRNISIQSQKIRNDFNRINELVVRLIQRFENIQVCYIEIYFVLYMIDDKIFCSVICEIAEENYTSNGPLGHIIIFLEPVELIPETKKEKINLSLLINSLMANCQIFLDS